MITHRTKLIAAALAAVTLVGTAGQAFADKNRYSHSRLGDHRYYGRYHRGIGPGGVVAGAALGVLGAAAAGVAADRYYNGYPAYNYGYDRPAYRYGYDYIPNHGYYGPF